MISEYMLAKSKRLFVLAEQGTHFPGAYTDKGAAWKEEWLKTGRSVLRAIGKELNFNEMRVWINKGGVAVEGEAMLMGMWDDIGIYVDTASPRMQYGPYSGAEAPAFMWRTITSLTDYSGGRNRWLAYRQFNDPNQLILTLKGMTSTPWIN